MAGEIHLLGEQSLLHLEGFGWDTVLEDFPGVPAGLDRSGRLWVVAQGGEAIAVWENEGWTMYAAESGWTPLTGPGATLATDPAGGIWLGTRQDVRLFDGELWTIFSPSDMSMRLTGGETMAVYPIEFASTTETVWVGECDLAGPRPAGGGGLRWWDGDRWRRGPPNDLGGCVLAVEEAPNGGVWAGIDERLWTYDPADQSWSELALPTLGEGSRPSPYILDLTFGPRGDLWVLAAVCGGASCSGNETLITHSGGEWLQVGEAGAFTSLPLFDGRATAWLATSAGVYRIQEQEPRLVADLQVLSAAVDDEGRLWLAARRNGELGLWVYRPD